MPDLADFPWLKVVQAGDGGIPDELANLGGGERDTILVARDRQADRVVLDDLQARRRAARLDIPIIGTVGILALAKEQGLVASLAAVLDELVEAGMWLSPEIRQHILDLAGEG